MWLVKAAVNRLLVMVLLAITWWMILLFILAVLATGSAFEGVRAVADAMRLLASPLLSWGAEAVMPEGSPAWVIQVLQIGLLVAVFQTVWRLVGWLLTWSVTRVGRWWFGARWAMAEAWWHSPVAGWKMRAPLGGAAAFAVVMSAGLLVVGGWNLGHVLLPLWWVAAVLELAFLAAALIELSLLPGFLCDWDEELATFIQANDVERARRRHEELVRHDRVASV